jgi:hypothetical protein
MAILEGIGIRLGGMMNKIRSLNYNIPMEDIYLKNLTSITIRKLY